MKKVIAKILVGIFVFTGAVYMINKVQAEKSADYTAEMDAASLPLIYGMVDGVEINTLHGYVNEEMDDSVMRDCVYPMEGSRKVSLRIDSGDYNMKSLSYEVRNADNASLVEQGKIKKITDADNNMKDASVNFRMELEEEQEYILKLIFESERGRKINYFTRIKYAKTMNALKQLEFVKNFNEAIFDKDKATDIEKYLEPKEDKVNNNLADVNINSSLEAVTFASLSPVKLSNPVPVITEITNDIASIELEYYIKAVNKVKTRENYRVKEYYRIRYTPERTYLLSYEREQEEMFQPESIDTANNALKIGITKDKDMDVIETDGAKKAAFVQEHQLWYYNYQKVEATKVFSFIQEDYKNPRDVYSNHDIKLIRADKNGNLEFAVYGYMNRGKHEGECGISINRYRANTNAVEELLFVPSNSSFENIRENVEKLCYLNEKNIFYMIYDGKLRRINVANKEVDTIVDNVTDENVVVSKDQTMVGIQEVDENQNLGKIQILNLESGKHRYVEAKSGEKVKSVGFIGQDFAYGKLKGKKADKDTKKYPMYEISIENMQGDVVKTYNRTKEKIYIMDTKMKENMIELDLYKKSGEKYTEVENDYIVNKESSDESAIVFDYTYSQERYNQLYMKFPQNIYIKDIPNVLNTKEVITDDYRVVTLDSEEEQYIRYFVYSKGSILSSFSEANEALKVADNNDGVVVNSKQKYIWKDGETPYYGSLKKSINIVKAVKKKDSLAAAIATICSYGGANVMLSDLTDLNEAPDAMIGRYMKNGGLDLTGCSLNEMLYFINKDCPVIAKNTEGHYLILISYNNSAIRYLDTVTGEEIRSDIVPVKKDFEAAGNVFYTYIP